MSKKKFDRIEKKKVWSVDRQIEVDDKTSTLSAKVDFNLKDCTWKVTASITTVQVDPQNDEVTQATIKTIGQIIEQAIEEAMDARAQLLDSTRDNNQQDLFVEGSRATGKK